MATIVPPPSKRQRTDAAERSRVQQDAETIPADAGSLRVQFYDEITGQPVGDGPVLVPVADANTANLELLINTLQGHVCLKLPRCCHDIAELIRTNPNDYPIVSPYQYLTRRARVPSFLRFRAIYGRHI